MDRRKFNQLAITALPGMTLTSLSGVMGCEEGSDLPKFNFDGKILIVGAGAAGLYAGYLLKQNGIDFQIIEASDRIGGRLGRIDDFADYPLDMGAQWLHGKKSVAGELANCTKTAISKDNSDLCFWFNGNLVKSLPRDVQSLYETSGLPDVSYIEYARQIGLDSAYDSILQAMASEHGASAEELSCRYAYEEFENWSSGGSDFKFSDSYFELIDSSLAAPIRENILLNTQITAIDYLDSEIIATDSTGNQFQAQRILVCVPISVLQQNSISFSPSMETEKTEAFNKIGFGPGMKVFLKFSTSFYDENILGGTVCASYADERIGKSGSDHVLMAFVMGNQATQLSALGSDRAISEALIAELDEMYDGQASSNFIDARVIDWMSTAFIGGAYSYSKVGIDDARLIAARSINSKVYFAGEAVNLNGHHQTVHGAMESALYALNQML